MKRGEVALRAPTTADEMLVVRALAKCTFRPGSADGRFCRDLAAEVKYHKKASLTEGQRAYLWRVAYRYRLQLPPALVAVVLAQVAAARIPGLPQPAEAEGDGGEDRLAAE
jgi:hypothetical protein